MSDIKILDENERGKITIEGNEVLATSLIPDAAKFRVRAPRVKGESGGGGAFSFDVLDPVDGRWKEMQLITGAMNDARGGEGKLIVLAEGGVIDDAHQITVMEWDSRKVEFKVPVSAPNIGSGATQGRFYSGERKFCFNVQDDPASGKAGRIVVYDTKGTTDESQWVAVGAIDPKVF